MLRHVAVLAALAACNEHGKSPARSDAGFVDALTCAGRELTGQVRDFGNTRSPGIVTFTPRDGGNAVQTTADGGFALCGASAGFVVDVAPPAGMVPGIAVLPPFSETDSLYRVLVASPADLNALFAQVAQTVDAQAGQVIVHQILGQLQPTLTGAAGMTLTGAPPMAMWTAGNGSVFVMFTNVAPGMQTYAPTGSTGSSTLVPVEAGRITYLPSLIVPD